MGKKNQSGNREPRKPKKSKLPPQRTAGSIAELVKQRSAGKK